MNETEKLYVGNFKDLCYLKIFDGEIYLETNSCFEGSNSGTVYEKDANYYIGTKINYFKIKNRVMFVVNKLITKEMFENFIIFFNVFETVLLDHTDYDEEKFNEITIKAKEWFDENNFSKLFHSVKNKKDKDIYFNYCKRQQMLKYIEPDKFDDYSDLQLFEKEMLPYCYAQLSNCYFQLLYDGEITREYYDKLITELIKNGE